MHIHSGSYEEGKKVFPLLITRGITGVRDMGCPPEEALRLRQETGEGKILGPRMIVAGPLIQGPLPFQMPLIVSVHNKIEASQPEHAKNPCRHTWRQNDSEVIFVRN